MVSNLDAAHPVDWRYGSNELRKLLSVRNMLKLQAEIEAIVAEVEAKYGLIPVEAAKAIREAANRVNVEEILEEEKRVKHDIVAVVNVLSRNLSEEHAKYIHFGLTSQDIKDTAFAVILKKALNYIVDKLVKIAKILIEYADKWKDFPCVGRTHGVHANVYSLGHKFAVFADEIIRHIERIKEGEKRFLVGKISGALGIHSVLGEVGIKVEEDVLKTLGLYPSKISTQVVPRDRYAEFFLILSLITSTLDRLATEIRNLHRTEISEILEGFEAQQVGSSAMPHKRNPIDCENISGLAKILRSLSVAVLENIVLWHERDLSNSSTERVLLADYILLLDEQLTRMIRVLRNLQINPEKIRSNMKLSLDLIYSEHLMYALIRKGLARIKAHNLVKRLSTKVLEEKKSLKDVALEDSEIIKYLSRDEIEEIFRPEKYLKAVPLLIEIVKKKFEEILKVLEKH